jgi:Tfp pilus assembly major pilin PilA
MKRNWIVILVLAILSFITVKHVHADSEKKGTGLFNISITGVKVEAKELIESLMKAIEEYFYKKPAAAKNDRYKENLEHIRYLLAKIAGQEAVLADQIDLAIEEAVYHRADQQTQTILNTIIEKVSQTFSELQSVVSPIEGMQGIKPELVSGLNRFTADSVLYVRDIKEATIFSINGDDAQLRKARQVVKEIRAEAKVLSQMAAQFKAALDSLKI